MGHAARAAFTDTLWTSTILPALPFVSIVLCWKFNSWRALVWVPATVVVYTILSTSFDALQMAILETYTEIPFPGMNYFSGEQILGYLLRSTFHVLACLLIVYLLTKCGYRFQRTVRHNANPS